MRVLNKLGCTGKVRLSSELENGCHNFEPVSGVGGTVKAGTVVRPKKMPELRAKSLACQSGKRLGQILLGAGNVSQMNWKKIDSAEETNAKVGYVGILGVVGQRLAQPVFESVVHG
jgi:hypothetical protein